MHTTKRVEKHDIARYWSVVCSQFPQKITKLIVLLFSRSFLTNLFTGVGCAAIAIAFYVDFYYNVIIAYALYYFFASFNPVLPWSTCTNEWNTKYCFEPISGPKYFVNYTTEDNVTEVINLTSSAATEYYEYVCFIQYRCDYVRRNWITLRLPCTSVHLVSVVIVSIVVQDSAWSSWHFVPFTWFERTVCKCSWDMSMTSSVRITVKEAGNRWCALKAS